MTTAAYHGALDAASGLRPVATANVTLAEFRHWAALVPSHALITLKPKDKLLRCKTVPNV